MKGHILSLSRVTNCRLQHKLHKFKSQNNPEKQGIMISNLYIVFSILHPWGHLHSLLKFKKIEYKPTKIPLS